MEVLRVDLYNQKQTIKWQQDHAKRMEEINRGERHISELPQLAFYLFNHKTGFIAFEGSKALWAKTKKGVIAWWEDEERKKKIRGW
jgi:hypothetical protein